VPARLELHQQLIGPVHGVEVAGDALRPAVLPLGHEVRTFQHGHVLLYGGKRHVIARGQFTDRRVGVHDPRQNVAARGIGQCPEQLVQGGGR
jgi:hypothetical protein